MEDLEFLEMGLVMDMLAESSNDDYDYSYVAEQADFDQF